MLKTVIQLHSDMKKGSSVPEFCWLLFARDTSRCPRSFITNHLRHVGFSGGLEQVCTSVTNTYTVHMCKIGFLRQVLSCHSRCFQIKIWVTKHFSCLLQVEMFLLGYSLQHTLQAYRLYKTDTEEFITYYPDDHRTEWPCLSLVTEDDRHYNVPVPVKQSKLQSTKQEKAIKPKWNLPSSGGTGKVTLL